MHLVSSWGSCCVLREMKGDILLVFAICLVVCECLDLLHDIKPVGIVLDHIVPHGILPDVIVALKDPDKDKNVTELITSKGYPVKEYTIQTSDGFLLSMQRIPYGRNESSGKDKKKVVLLVHGLFASADCYVINFQNQSLGFILADSGYDVWLGNTRGSTYSMKHVKYTQDQKEFWDFSFTEVGLYDLPAMINYVLEATGEEKLYYIGHSQGTTAAFVMLSEKQKYNEKIKLLVCLAPVAFIGHVGGPLRLVAPFTDDLEKLAKLFGVKDLFPDAAAIALFKKLFCNPLNVGLCENLLFAIFSSDTKQLNETRLPLYAQRFPADSSVKSFVHYGQLMNSKTFSTYNYFDRNMDYYQQETPPEFDLSVITAPIALLRGTSDYYANSEDISILRGKLKSVVSNYLVPFHRFNHIDFIFAVDADRLCYRKVLSLMVKY